MNKNSGGLSLIFQSQDQAILHSLPSDMRALIAHHELRPTKIEKVSGLDTTCPNRGSYRIEVEEGRILKGRSLASPYLAQRVHSVNQQVGSRLLSPIIARHGCAVLEEWVEGTSLNVMSFSSNLARKAGRLLGEIHSSSADVACMDYGHTISTRAQQIQDAIEILESRAMISSLESSCIADIVRDAKPSGVDYGIVHGDLAAENVVLSESRLVAVDNGGLSYDALDFDLARTWYRWPMNEEISQSFCEGYQQFRDVEQFHRHFAFWAICVLCRAALFHVREDTGLEDAVVNRLKKLMG